MHLDLVRHLGRNSRTGLEHAVLHALGRHFHGRIQNVLGEECSLVFQSLGGGSLLVVLFLLLHAEQQVLQGRFRSGIRQQNLASGVHFILEGNHQHVHLDRDINVGDSLPQVHTQSITVAVHGTVQGNLGSRGGNRLGGFHHRLRIIATASNQNGTYSKSERITHQVHKTPFGLRM